MQDETSRHCKGDRERGWWLACADRAAGRGEPVWLGERVCAGRRDGEAARRVLRSCGVERLCGERREIAGLWPYPINPYFQGVTDCVSEGVC